MSETPTQRRRREIKEWRERETMRKLVTLDEFVSAALKSEAADPTAWEWLLTDFAKHIAWIRKARPDAYELQQDERIRNDAEMTEIQRLREQIEMDSWFQS